MTSFTYNGESPDEIKAMIEEVEDENPVLGEYLTDVLTALEGQDK